MVGLSDAHIKSVEFTIAIVSSFLLSSGNLRFWLLARLEEAKLTVGLGRRTSRSAAFAAARPPTESEKVNDESY